MGTAAAGDSCMANSDCDSGICLLFQDVPVPTDAVCGDAEPMCQTRVTGTVFDFVAGTPLSGATVNVVKALEAITNPSGATPLVSGMSGSDGTFDQTTAMAVSSPFGIVAIVSDSTHYLTATGVAAPDANAGMKYDVGTGIHEFWGIPKSSLTDWSTALGMDAAIPPDALPLGDNGGVIGFVRDATTGTPLMGATVVPMMDSSVAVVRYVADDGSIVSDMTQSSGIFIIIGAKQTGEEFDAQVGGMTVGSGTAGQAPGVVFSLILNATTG